MDMDMVFSSIPVYPDPPNWHHQQPFHQTNDGITATTANNQNQFSHLVAPPAQHPPQADQGSSFIRSLPAGMADRARLAKLLPQAPDLQLVAQKCPRCDSANTKFCYFNNYSLTQPRHFCKTCRRYWTRGGALRNVPVGGGCRRNKRNSKASGKSKSPATSVVAGGSSTTSSATFNNNNNNNGNLNGNLVPLGQQPQLGFFNPMHNLSNFGTGENLGLDFVEMGFLGGGAGFGNARVGIDQWRIMPQPSSQVQQQIHLEQQPSGSYRYDQNEEGVKQQALDFANLGGVKNEQPAGLNVLSRNFMDVQGNHDQYWGGGGSTANDNNGATWNNNAHHLSAFDGSSTTGHHF